MSDENKRKLSEQLIRCVLDDKLDKDVKLRKMDYIIKMGGDINAECGLGFSVLSLAKMMQNDELVNFLEERGAEDIGFDSIKAEEFFRTASVDDINKFLKILPDGFVLDCDVDLGERGLKELPDFSRVVVNGNFDCHNNQLTSLKGAPSEVGEDFDCHNNQLTSLEGVPSEVGDNFDCSHNKLTTLKGGPSEVGGTFDCQGNQLTSLRGAPSEVGRSFICNCNQLTSLEGAPSKIEGSFDCGYNQLTTLKGAPSEVGVGFDCHCNQLTSLEGGPRIVEGNFYCSDNPLKSYEGKPGKIGGKFIAPKIEQVNIINGGNGR